MSVLAERAENRVGIPRERLTWRSGIILLACVVGISVAGCVSVFLRYDLIGTGHLPRCALYPILLLLFLNVGLRRFKRIKTFTKTELLFIYSSILVMTGIPGQQFATYVYLGPVGPIYYATPQNQYAERFHRNIPNWAVPSKDPQSPVVAWLFEGMPEDKGFWDIPWRQWVRPLTAWSTLELLVFFLILCVSSMLRKQWVERERLLFPLAKVPVEVVDGGLGAGLFKKKMVWIAFSIPFLIYLMNGLQKFFPVLPQINLYPSTKGLFSDSPWNVLNWLPMNYYFDMIAIAYMLTTEVGFSFWFFFIFEKIQTMMRVSAGIPADGEIFQFQNIGGILILGLFYLWVGRSHWKTIFENAIGRLKSPEQDQEPMSYRFMFWGALVGLTGILLWCKAAGIPLSYSLGLMAFYFLIIIILTRIVSEAGIFVWWAPIDVDQFIVRAVGPKLLQLSSVPMLSLVGWNLQDVATCVMPQALSAFKISADVQVNRKQFTGILMLAIFIAVMCCHIPSLYMTYREGVPNLGWWTRGSPKACTDKIDRQMSSRLSLDKEDSGHMLQGGLFTLFLLLMRQRFLRWPFHPLGYIASVSIARYWWSILLGWSIKAAVTKIGGIGAWRKYYPAALGLLIGNCVILFTWLLFHFFKPIQGVLIIE